MSSKAYPMEQAQECYAEAMLVRNDQALRERWLELWKGFQWLIDHYEDSNVSTDAG